MRTDGQTERLHEAIQLLIIRERTGCVFDWDPNLTDRFDKAADLISSHSRDGTALGPRRLSRQKCKVSLDSDQESFTSLCVCVCM